MTSVPPRGQGRQGRGKEHAAEAQNADRPLKGSSGRALKIPGRPDQAGRQGLLKAPFKSLRPSYLGPVDKL